MEITEILQSDNKEAITVTPENIDEIIRGVKEQIAKSPTPKRMYLVWCNEPRKRLNYKAYKGRGRPKYTDYVMAGNFDYLKGYLNGKYSKNGNTRNIK